MPRNNQVMRQWHVVRRLEASGASTLQQLVNSLPPDLPRHPRTLRRDLEALEEVGFPLVTESVDGQTRWRLMDGFRRIPALSFSATEVMALVLDPVRRLVRAARFHGGNAVARFSSVPHVRGDEPYTAGGMLEGGVLTRLDDMKKVCGIIVYPRRIEALVRPHRDVDESQIVFRRRDGLDDILVRLDPSPTLPLGERARLGDTLAKDLQLGLGIRVSVEVGEPGSRPRWDHKARRVKDERTEVPF